MPYLTIEERQRWWRETLGAPRFVMAPMVLQSELAFRLLSRRHGCDLCYSPMLPAAAFLAGAAFGGTFLFFWLPSPPLRNRSSISLRSRSAASLDASAACSSAFIISLAKDETSPFHMRESLVRPLDEPWMKRMSGSAGSPEHLAKMEPQEVVVTSHASVTYVTFVGYRRYLAKMEPKEVVSTISQRRFCTSSGSKLSPSIGSMTASFS